MHDALQGGRKCHRVEVRWMSLRGKSKKRQRIESDDEGTDKAVLPVATFDETFTETSTPTTGEQYLALVQVRGKASRDCHCRAHS